MTKKTKIIIAIISSIVIVAGIITGILVLRKDKPKENIEVTALEVLKPLEVSDSSKAANQTISNVVKITNKLNDKQTIYGTGFFDKSGYLITNSHVVDIEGELSIEYTDGTTSKAQIYSNDIISDIALLSVEDVKVKALPTKSTLDLELTDEVYSIGYQLNLKGNATITRGILSAKRVASGIEFLQTDSPVNSGGSGGPVINDKGQVLGMVTLASDNATLSFAISSDTLELYIEKLIKAKTVTYITEKRATNALSAVLKEVNYQDDDIYDEDDYFEKDNDDEDNDKDDDDDKKESSSSTPSNPVAPEKDYTLEALPYYMEVPKNEPLSTDIKTYFKVGKDLTNCKLDLSKVNVEIGGEYEIIAICDQKSATKKITNIAPIPPSPVKIPTFNMDETKNNVTSFDQVKGYWFYPGYKDVCIGYTFVVDSYSFETRTFDTYNNRLSYNNGGGYQYYTFEEILAQQKLWLEGDWLAVTTNGHTMYFTRKPGQGIYNETHMNMTGWCE